MRAVFKLENHCSTRAVLVLVPVFHIVFSLCSLSALCLALRLCARLCCFARSAPHPPARARLY
jgi:hypothetical protein